MLSIPLQPQPLTLLLLAQAQFGPLSLAEIKLLTAAQSGGAATCGSTANLTDPSNHPSSATQWEPTRSIRADLIRWVCVEPSAREKVGLSGIHVIGAQLIGELNLSHLSVPFGVSLLSCHLTAPANFYSASLSELDLRATWLDPAEPNFSGTTLMADGIRTKGNIFFSNGFRAKGEVRLRGANIDGSLDCENGTFLNPSKMALDLDHAKIGGYVFLRNGFSAQGEIKLLNVEIGSNLECVNAKFTNPFQQGAAGSGKALTADSIRVAGYAFLRNGFHAEGQVTSQNAQIGSDIECDKATFRNPSHKDTREAGIALCLDGARVNGSVFLGEEFDAEGEVQISRAQIRGHLSCAKARIDGRFLAQANSIGGGLFWTNIIEPEKTELDIVNTHVDALVDDRPSWPENKKLRIDGLAYERFSGSDTPKSAKARLDWLSRQKTFAPQPYRQVARVLRNNGDDLGFRRVLCEMERRRRKHESAERILLFRLLDSAWSHILDRTIGFGFHPARALLWLAVLTALGTLLFNEGYATGSLAPRERDAYREFKSSGVVPPYYEHFNPLIYSIENSFPLVHFGQADHWQPALDTAWQYPPNGRMPAYLTCLVSPWSLRRMRWLQILLGWFFTTMGVAAVTGIINKE